MRFSYSFYTAQRFRVGNSGQLLARGSDYFNLNFCSAARSSSPEHHT